MSQSRLQRFQLVNWGTFSGYWHFPVPRRGLLLTGPSGAGKSSILDAIGSILVRPSRLRFNAAAQGTETGDRDRNLVTYVRGAYKRETDETTGEAATTFLRTGPTWSAVALTFADEAGGVTTLIRLFHLRGSSNDPADLQSMYLIAPEPVELPSLAPHVKHGIELRRVKAAFNDWQCFGHNSYSGFAAKFRRQLGLASEQAQILLHKAQSAKNLTSLDALFRDFMLEPPDTFTLSDDMVAQFDELSVAHATVVDARKQLHCLEPLRTCGAQLEQVAARQMSLRQQEQHLEGWIASQLLVEAEDDLATTTQQLDAARAELEHAEQAVQVAATNRVDAQRAYDRSGGVELSTLTEQENDRRELLREREGRRGVAAEAAQTLGLSIPSSRVGWSTFAEQLDRASQEVARAAAEHQQRTYAAATDRGNARTAQQQVAEELAALRQHRSNIDPRLLELRARLAQRLLISAEDLPFVGELLQVRAEDSRWTGAVERVLGAFARTLVVPAQHYHAAAEVIDHEHLGARLAYERVDEHSAAGSSPDPGADSLVHKVEIAEGPFAGWLDGRLRSRFDYACVLASEEFDRHRRAVTLAGQIKHSPTRHEKDDRRRVNDRTGWVLGFSIEAKEADIIERLAAAERHTQQTEAALANMDGPGRDIDRSKRAVDALRQLAWEDIETESVRRDLATTRDRLAALRRPAGDLAVLETVLEAAIQQVELGEQARRRAASHHDGIAKEQAALASRAATLRERLRGAPVVPAEVASELDRRRAPLQSGSKHWEGPLREALVVDRADVAQQRTNVEHRTTGQMREYQRSWPSQAADWNDEVTYLPEFLQRLQDLEEDRLPEFENRFFDLLQNQALRNIGQLAAEIKGARRAIRLRVDEVNKSLLLTEFTRGGYLQIEVRDRALAEVDEFLATLNAITTGSLEAGPAEDAEQREEAEQRFGRMRTLLDRLGSSDPADRAWRNRCLDTRRHVHFQARVQDEAGQQLDVYTGSGGRSGGERQKLVSFCLAAALRFQLAPEGQQRPTYALVVIDEAFDKADHLFTQAGLEVFKTFGFQLLLATPLKMLQTIEDYVGGVVMVNNNDGRQSRLDELIYETDGAAVSEPPQVGPEVQPQQGDGSRSQNDGRDSQEALL